MPLSFCVEQACKNFAVPKSLRCTDHKREHVTTWNREQRNPAQTKFYNSARWKGIRRRKLEANPVCEVPTCTQGATDVDHIIGLNDGGDWFDTSNLQSLCHECHAKKTAAEIAARIGRSNNQAVPVK